MKRLMWIAVVALIAGCGKDEAAPSPTPIVLSGDLDLEIRDKAALSIQVDGATTQVTVQVSKGFGVLPEGTALTGAGAIEAFPESDGKLYTARLSVQATPGGPCGAQPVSIGLSLHRDEANDRVTGGMAAYCGASVWHGRPVRVLRLAGSLSQ